MVSTAVLHYLLQAILSNFGNEKYCLKEKQYSESVLNNKLYLEESSPSLFVCLKKLTHNINKYHNTLSRKIRFF